MFMAAMINSAHSGRLSAALKPTRRRTRRPALAGGPRSPDTGPRTSSAGRRAVVIGGPDVWEAIAAARSAPERGDQLVRALAERTGTPVEKVRSAIRYYGEFPEEVDSFISANEQEAEQFERALENEQRLLG